MIGRDPVHARDDARPTAFAVAVEHAHSVQARVFGYAVTGPANCARDVRAVPPAIVRVLPVVENIESGRHAALKFLVRAPNAGVNDVNIHASPGGVVRIFLIQRQVALIYAVESPRGVVLRGVLLRVVFSRDRLDADFGVLFDVGDAWVEAERQSLLFGHLHRIAVERVTVCHLDPRAVDGRERAADFSDRRLALGDIDRIVAQHDDVAVGDGVRVFAEFLPRLFAALRARLHRPDRKESQGDQQKAAHEPGFARDEKCAFHILLLLSF